MVTENYIVRIYRRDEVDSEKASGIVEDIGAKGKRVFKNFDELLVILRSPETRPSAREEDGGETP